MGRPVNRKCQHCATLAVEDAIALHGSAGDGCWNPDDKHKRGYDCHRRRNHYRHRQDANAARRRMRKHGKMTAAKTTDILELTPPIPPVVLAAVLVLYRQHKDAPVHAVAAEVWQGDRKQAEVKPVHCLGMRGNQVSAYIGGILTQLQQQFGVSRFEDVLKELPVERCPITPCPLRLD